MVHAQVPLRQQLQLGRPLGVWAAQQGAACGRIQHDHGCGAGDCDGVGGALVSVRMLALNCERVCVYVCVCQPECLATVYGITDRERLVASAQIAMVGFGGFRMGAGL